MPNSFLRVLSLCVVALLVAEVLTEETEKKAGCIGPMISGKCPKMLEVDGKLGCCVWPTKAEESGSESKLPGDDGAAAEDRFAAAEKKFDSVNAVRNGTASS